MSGAAGISRRALMQAGAAGTALAWFGPAGSILADARPGAQSDSARLAAFFEEIFEAGVARSPERETSLGYRYDRGAWDDDSDAVSVAEFALRRKDLERLRAEFDPAALPEQDRLSIQIYEYNAAADDEAHRWRHHAYALSHLGGRHNGIPSFLINQHRIRTSADAAAYIQRVRTVGTVLETTLETLRARADMGVMPPRFSLEKALTDARSVPTGQPLTADGSNSLYGDFKKKLGDSAIPEAQRGVLQAEMAAALNGPFRAAYADFIAGLEPLVARATADDGVWKLPDGQEFYRHRIRRFTTRDMTAEQVHALGLAEVKRIHGEIDAIRRQVKFDGDLKAFLAFLRDDPQFQFADDDAGREEYIALSRKYIDAMRPLLPKMFITLPKADVDIRRVEAFRERSSARAFYNGPPQDGSQPGIYFINLFNMGEHRRHGVETLAYHEGIPGHHMQVAIARELGNLPRFRRFGGYSAYSEGWALYTEKLVKEFGAFSDPYSDYGRLEGELFRAIRLVVDTGIHAMKWTRRQGIYYMTFNSAIPEPRATREIERYIVNPGQALSYKIGMQTIEDLRAMAVAKLGAAFDLRRFHDTILTAGPIPLAILEERVAAWVAAGGA